MKNIPDIIEWSRSRSMDRGTWLMLGKGPSYGKLRNVDTSAFRLVSLNHVVRQHAVEIAHIIDLDVVHDCADAIDANAGVLWMPAHPHVACKPSEKPLWEWAREVPVLRKLAAEGRLAWYNASTWKRPEPGSPLIEVRFFSAEAALAALAAAGASTVRSLGVDGGNTYSGDFADLRDKTLLANGHASFDRQFEGFAKTLRTTGIFYAPLWVNAPVRVFVGTDSAQMLGVKMLEYSIKKYASLSVTVEPIDDEGIPVPLDPANRSRTGFSFSRFKIPELCGYRGRGIYMDADMQVFTDILDLWARPFEGARILYADGPAEKGRVPQFSVLLLDCANLDWDVREIVKGFDEGRFNYADLMQKLCIAEPEHKRAGLPFEWNSLEHYEPGATKLIHYTDMPTQPWVSHNNKNGQLFYDAVRQALAEGFVSPDYVYEELAKGHISPEFPGWVGLPPPPDFAALKANWKAPYQRFVGMPTAKLKQAAG
ncbi:TPA: hypothetical protein NKO30_006722 [Pseudomonas aeruginosa]|nr:hypothetical protein [Pseudomonas aeruginosa]